MRPQRRRISACRWSRALRLLLAPRIRRRERVHKSESPLACPYAARPRAPGTLFLAGSSKAPGFRLLRVVREQERQNGVPPYSCTTTVAARDSNGAPKCLVGRDRKAVAR